MGSFRPKVDRGIGVPSPAPARRIMIISTKPTADYLTKSRLPASDYVINPYTGCPHGCKYCYAAFMRRFTGHKEPWGEFIDVKLCEKPINVQKLEGKSVFLSSVTDCYNPLEAEYRLTRSILEQLLKADCSVGISTKSSLILRDLDILTQFKNLTVSVSVNTLDEGFRADMDRASPIAERLRTLKALHENGVRAILFMSPIFPYITDFKAIIEASRTFTDEYWFENLNLRGGFKKEIMDYVALKYPQYFEEYRRIYNRGDSLYWQALAEEINAYCSENGLKFTNYFYHSQLVDEKIKARKSSS